MSRVRLRQTISVGLVAVIGLLSSLIYYLAFTKPYYLPRTYAILPPVDVGKLSHYSSDAGLANFGSVLVLFIGYIFAWVIVRRLAGTWRRLLVVLGFGLLFGCVLMAVYPITAIDLFGYVARGRVLAVHHVSPFLHPPSEFPGDPTSQYAGGWYTLASPYGPAWEWLAALAALIGGNDFLRTILVFKGLVIGAYVLDAFIIWQILGRIRPEARLAGALLFAWNPLVLLETAANGHNDVVMLLPVLIAIWFLTPRRGSSFSIWRGALVLTALVLAIWVKYIPLILGPLVLVAVWRGYERWRARISAALLAVLLSLILTAVLWVPIWPGLDHLMVLEEAGRVLFSPASLVIQMLEKLGWTGDWVTVLVTRVAIISYGIIYLVILARVRRGAPSLITASLVALWAYLLVGGLSFRHWYPLWLLPLAALCPNPALVAGALVFSLLAELSPAYYTFGYIWWGSQIGWDGLVAIGIPIIFGLPLLVALVVGLWQRKQSSWAKASSQPSLHS